MANEIVNPQITDAVTSANTKTLCEVAAIATNNLSMAVSSSAAASIQNQVENQKNSTMIHQASTTQGINILYSVDTSATAQATDTVNRSTDSSKMIDYESILKLLLDK